MPPSKRPKANWFTKIHELVKLPKLTARRLAVTAHRVKGLPQQHRSVRCGDSLHCRMSAIRRLKNLLRSRQRLASWVDRGETPG
jgi:hypothetical protein